jgi:hypothetical protein
MCGGFAHLVPVPVGASRGAIHLDFPQRYTAATPPLPVMPERVGYWFPLTAGNASSKALGRHSQAAAARLFE